jgi:hypothetical protein
MCCKLGLNMLAPRRRDTVLGHVSELTRLHPVVCLPGPCFLKLPTLAQCVCWYYSSPIGSTFDRARGSFNPRVVEISLPRVDWPVPAAEISLRRALG